MFLDIILIFQQDLISIITLPFFNLRRLCGMITKTFACPDCKTRITGQGNPGEKVQIVCPNCGKKGVAIFPSVKTEEKAYVNIIEIINLTKHFGKVRANDGVNFSVRKGEIFGFLGPNGAGKTTAIKLMMGLTHPTSGEVRIGGNKVKIDTIDIRKYIGYLPEQIGFYDNLTPVQTLNFFCELKGVDKSIVMNLLKDVGLEDTIDRKVGTFSKGMKQLLGIAQAMIGNPAIYVLDEPMGGLDARWVKIVREKIMMLNKAGATIVFSSHILSEVQNVCHRVAVINKGKIIAENTIDNLNQYLRIIPRLEINIPGLNGKVPEGIVNIQGVERAEAKGDLLLVTCDSSARPIVLNFIEKKGMIVSNFKTIEPSLEDAFVKLISKQEGAT
jgi:ABC-type multidrug transport system ATPase subunit